MKRLCHVLSIAALLALQGCGALRHSASDCTSSTANASYAGPYRGAENNLSTQDLARDVGCAYRFKAEKYPRGFVAIYGSSRIGENNTTQADPAVRAANNELYQGVRQFANRWTRLYGGKYPILTGAGPGLMEAGSRGATEAGGPSIGYTTYYGPSRDKGGDARLAFQQYKDKDGKLHDIVSDGLIFSSVAVRESMMIMHSAAIVIAPGGSGTEWEIFQILESMKSQQLNPVPIFLVGNKERYWKSFEQRLREMAAVGTLRTNEVTDLFVYVENPEDVLEMLQRKMSLN